MNQVQSVSEFHNTLTPAEFCLIEEIVGCYDFKDNKCFSSTISQLDSGAMLSLLKKGLVTCISYSYMPNDKGKYYPSNEVLDIYGLDYHGKSC